MKKSAIVVGVALAFAVGGAGSASALTSNAAGVQSWTSAYGGFTNGKVSVYDSASGFDVKVEYKRSGLSTKYTLTNSLGSGTTRSLSFTTNPVTHIHGCEVIPINPDICGAWDPSNPF